jgi:RNA polymerase sigma-70 factor (ECF subfamily)
MKGGERLNDLKLLEKLKCKNERALELVIKQYGGYVYTIVHNILVNMTEQDLEETVADVFIKLWNHAEYIESDKPLKPYLIGIARNTAKNKLREISLTVSLEDDELFINDDVEDIIERKEIFQIINETLQTLKPEDRSIFIQYYYHYEKIKNIAAIHKVSESAIKMKLHRIRKVLLEALSERGYSNEG